MSSKKLKKVTKSQVEAKLRKGEAVTVWLCPSKAYPNIGHPFNCAIRFIWTPIDFLGLEVQRNINSFAYYNCNAELGKTVHYYLEEK